MQVHLVKLCHGWTPQTGFFLLRLGRLNKAIILYLLALDSPTFPIRAHAWAA
jgi:hypothetical protein